MKKKLIGLILMSVLVTPLQAKPNSDRIFPEYTGLKSSVSNPSVEVSSYPSRYSPNTITLTNSEIYVVGMNQDWYRIRSGNTEGWVAKNVLANVDEAVIPYSKVLGEEIVEYGKLFIGTPYVWGGNDLRRGVDCSGLTKQVFEGFDINISRLSYTQVNDGKRVAKSELMPGDLVFFDTTEEHTGQISHVGIYAGEGMFLHADCTKGVTLSPLSSNYYTRNYVVGSRILNNLS